MRLGGSKGHVAGENVSGTHTTLIGVAERIVREMAKQDLFTSVRPGEISHAHGGKIGVTIRTHSSEHVETLRILFRQSGVVQEVFFHVTNFRKRQRDVIDGIKNIVREEYPGTEARDCTSDASDNVSDKPKAPSPEAERLLEKYRSRK